MSINDYEHECRYCKHGRCRVCDGCVECAEEARRAVRQAEHEKSVRKQKSKLKRMHDVCD